MLTTPPPSLANAVIVVSELVRVPVGIIAVDEHGVEGLEVLLG